MGELLKPKRKSTRFNEIVNILLKHDFWGLLRTIQRGQITTVGDDAVTVRMRKILEELGPTFIKIGQLLATRPDLVPPEFSEEFKNLYDGTTPSPYPEVREVIRAELGGEIEEFFTDFSHEAIASASVGQVHIAHLKDGQKVAVKVQHVGIEESMLLDFQILEGLLTFIEKTFAASRVWQPTQHLEELRVMLERELDYQYEVKNTLKVAHNFRHDETVHIPSMYPDLCSKRVMVMEFIDGIKFAHPTELDRKGIDRKNVAKIITHAMAKQIFVHRLFHADPSPGNMMILGSNQVVFLDFGAVGQVTERRSKTILRLITGIGKKNVEDTVEAIVDLCEQTGEHDEKRFHTDVEKILDYFEREEVSVADPRMMEMIMDIATEHRMLLPPDFMLISRALFQFDGFCHDLDPDYELVSVLEPLVGELVWKNIANTKKQKELVEETVGELLKFARAFPHTLNQLVRRVERNELRTTIDIAGLEGFKQAQGRSTLKMSFTVLMAALIIGLGIVYSGPSPDEQSGQFLFGAGGLVVVWTLVMVFWSEAMKGNRER
ncbi:MAG: ABC1 kinase family protein [Thermoplasmatota archaeon]